MPRREGNRLLLDGQLTVDTVPQVLASAATPDLDGVEIVDFAGVTEADSAAVALVIGWLRDARARGRNLRFEHLPPGLTKLVQLYSVADLLPAK